MRLIRGVRLIIQMAGPISIVNCELDGHRVLRSKYDDRKIT